MSTARLHCVNIKIKSSLVRSLDPSGESTTTECGLNYQLLAVITEVAQWVTPGCSRPQPATDNGVRDDRSNWLVASPPSTGQYPLSSTYYKSQCGLQITRFAATSDDRTRDLRNASRTLSLCGLSGLCQGSFEYCQALLCHASSEYSQDPLCYAGSEYSQAPLCHTNSEYSLSPLCHACSEYSQAPLSLASSEYSQDPLCNACSGHSQAPLWDASSEYSQAPLSC